MVKWFQVIDPHQDIKDGNFDESVFAADLGDVVRGAAPTDYNDPYLFFRKTFFTKGITNLLSKVATKLKEGKGSSVIEIKTPFGGGKTHALITIYHYLNNSRSLQEQLPLVLPPVDAKKAIIVGTHLNPLEGNEREGIRTMTLWGDLALQLGGEEGYQEFKNNDTERISPGKEKLRQFLETKQPFILLFDEILEYIVKANGVSYAKTNLGSQTFAFFQELTETVGLLDNGMMIVTLPASVLEDYSGQGVESLSRLTKIFMRLESIETPVEGEEVYSVITKRLFGEILQPSAKKEIIHQYTTLYHRLKDELPSKVKDANYRRRLELAYPFHPEVIDVLYERWGTFSSFQRTRGVLRMLANVIEDLYNSGRNIDLILPSDLNLDSSPVRQEFLAHIDSAYESIIGSDIAGHDAKARRLDQENVGWNHLAERVATATFFYSFSVRMERGIDLKTLKLVCLHQDTLSTLVTEVLHQIYDPLVYLNENETNNTYYFSKIPTLRKMILERKVSFENEYLTEMEAIVKQQAGKAILWPQRSEDIPDTRELKLIVIHPHTKETEIADWVEKRGATFRTFKNTLVFAIPTPRGLSTLKDQVLTYLALGDIKHGIESGQEETLKDKLPDVKERIKQLHEDFSYNVRQMYNVILVGKTQYSLGQPKIGKENLFHWYRTFLLSQERIVRNLHYRVLVNKFLVNKEILPTKSIMEQFYKDPTQLIPESEMVLKRALQLGVKDGAFGIGFKEDGTVERESFRFKTNIAPSVITFNEGELMVSKSLAQSLEETFRRVDAEEQVKIQEGTPSEVEDQAVSDSPTDVKEEVPSTSTKTGPQKFTKVFLRVEDIPSQSLPDISQGVILPISKEIGRFNLTLELDIESQDGISASIIKTRVLETLSQIGARVTKKEIK